jgi:hypothetical protein
MPFGVGFDGAIRLIDSTSVPRVKFSTDRNFTEICVDPPKKPTHPMLILTYQLSNFFNARLQTTR